MDEAAFAHALKVFNRVRGDMTVCLRRAIEAYLSYLPPMKSLPKGLRSSVADTDDGPGTAIVITGFKNIDEINDFIGKLHSSGK